MDYSELEHIKTPQLDSSFTMMDADEELLPIAKFILRKSSHHEDVDIEKIKFLYTSKAKKDGGRYILGDLVKRPDYEILINPDYDFCMMIYYPVWKELSMEHKVIQLDKLLCGIEVKTDTEELKIGKKPKDCREYMDNMHQFGLTKVVESSDIVHLTCERLAEEAKEAKKEATKSKKKNHE